MPQYYPALNQLIQVEQIPDPLRIAISESLDKLFYKGYYAERNLFGDVAYYNLTIVLNSKIGLNVFGGDDGFELLFNPGEVTGTTEIPLSLYYNLPILKYIRTISTSQLSTSKDYFNVIVKLLEISPSRVLFEAVQQFFTGSIEGFVNQFNANPDYSTFPPLNINNFGGNDDEVVFEISNQLESYGINVYTYISEELISVENDIPASFENLYTLFRGILGDYNSQKILGLFIPKFSVSIQTLQLALAFPRTWLKPVDANGEVIEDDSKSLLTYHVGSLSYHSEKGLEFINPDSFDLTPSQIGNTGLLVEIRNLKFDFRNDKNIPEADADGRGLDFKGVYAQYAAVTLPKKWFNSEENNVRTTARIAGYDLLVGTGGVSGTIALETVKYINPDGQITDYFSSYFDFQYPIKIKAGNIETPIADYIGLLAYMNNSANVGWQFMFPLSIIKSDSSTATFERVRDYHLYLNTCDSAGPKFVKTVGNNGFEVSFSSFDITFKQNKVIESNIIGGLKIPRLKDALGNDAVVDVTGHLDSDGDFLLTASEQDGFAPIEIPQVLKLYVQGVELGQEDGRFFIGTTAEVEFTNAVMNKLLCNEGGGDNLHIALPAVRIYSNGNFEIVGGGIPLPTNFRLCLGPVKIAITNLNYSSHQQEYNGVLREYKCWGFDGALNLNPLGVEVRGDGVKYYYTIDDDIANGRPHHSYIRITTISVDIIIPGNASPSSATAIINGYLSIPEPGVSGEFGGGISLKLPKLGISGSAEMRLTPKYPAFIVDANVELPIAIPLASTGLGVFGFRGLFGFRYVAEKEAVGLTSGVDSWYDYYVYPQRGINIQKFNGPEQTTNYKDPVSIGAGASIATYASEDILSFRVFLLLSIPSLFMIEGKASVLSKRLGLDDTGEPPFFAFLAIGDSSIEAGMGADFKLPQDNGWILDLQAKVEAGFFFKNPSAWYINFGTRKEPITARVLTLITAWTYLELSAKGIAAGARADFEFDKKFGPVRVAAYLYVEVGGYVSFERPQLGGYLAAGGGAKVDVKIISVSIALDLVFGAEAAKPFLIYGKFRLCVKVKVVFIKVKFCAEVELKWEKSRQVDRTPIPPLAAERVLELAKGVHMLTGDTFDIVQLNTNITDPAYVPSANNNKFNNTVVPLDTYIDIRFEKGMDPNPVAAKTGGVNNAPQNYVELIPPQRMVNGKELRQVKHAYSMEDIEVFAWNGSQWVAYNPYVALAGDASDLTAQQRAALKLGYWQKVDKTYNALRLLGDNPFSYTQLGEPGWYVPEQMGVTAASLFCTTPALLPRCADWTNKDIGTGYPLNGPKLFSNKGIYFHLKGAEALERELREVRAVVSDKENPFGFTRSLEFPNYSDLDLRLPNPSKRIVLKLTTAGEGVTLKYYRPLVDDTRLEPGYVLVGQQYKTNIQLAQEVVYESPDNGINRVLVTPDYLDLEQIHQLNEELQAFNDTGFGEAIANGGGEIVLSDQLDLEEVEHKKQEILDLILNGCIKNAPGNVLTGGIGQMQIGTSFVVGARDVILDSLEDFTQCTTLVHEVCWLSEVDHEFNMRIPTQPAIQEDFDRGTQAVAQTIAPIWRPDTKYYIHIALKDTVDGDAQTGAYHYYYGFRTAGPIGHYHNASGVSYGGDRDGNGKLLDPDKYPLTNLRKYIDYNRSYPNADGNLLRAKPLFYSNQEAKLELFFMRPQSYHLFNTWPAFDGLPAVQGTMKVMIKDPTNDTLIPYPLPPEFDETTIPGGTEAWEEDDASLMPDYLKQWNAMAAAQECTLIGGSLVRPKSKKLVLAMDRLKPRKLYMALVYNAYQGNLQEVHRYGFQTSRYANFGEQVNSYVLDDGNGHQKEAVFKIMLDLSPTAIDTAYSLVLGEPDSAAEALEDRYTDYFDRVIEGVFGISPLAPPMGTEFNAIVNQNTGDTVALWIRNPEPFNDPKLPGDALGESLKILNNANDDPDNNYRLCFAKDGAQVLIMRNNKKITNTTLRLRFRYLLWDGGAYTVQDTVLVENLHII